MLASTIRKAVDFLISQQSPDGAWRDFVLEPGESDAWVTAYVGGCLSQVPADLIPPGLDEALDRAAQWLRHNMRADGGWGYNGNCPIDSDSTALAVLFLSACGGQLPDECYDRLLEFQQPDGGFATFKRRDPSDAWGISHPDVSPVVLRALLARLPLDNPAISRGLAYSVSTLGPESLWKSYWWTTPLYATLANVRLLAQIGTPYERALVARAVQNIPMSRNSFEQALLGEILTIFDPGDARIADLGRDLAEHQYRDGSWRASAPILRVPDSRCLRFQDTRAGLVTSDRYHLLTTATVVRCLSVLNRYVSGTYNVGQQMSGQK